MEQLVKFLNAAEYETALLFHFIGWSVQKGGESLFTRRRVLIKELRRHQEGLYSALCTDILS